MSYSCSDFTDDIIEALGAHIPERCNDSPYDQAVICIKIIRHLQESNKKLINALTPFTTNSPDDVMVKTADAAIKFATAPLPKQTRGRMLVDRINRLANIEGWCLIVDDDSMVTINTDHDSPHPKGDAYSHIEMLVESDAARLHHVAAYGLHGATLDDESEN